MADKDHVKRSLVKTITWRVMATLTTIVLVWIFTGEPLIALGIGFVEVFAKMAIYFIHERTWENIDWGKGD